MYPFSVYGLILKHPRTRKPKKSLEISNSPSTQPLPRAPAGISPPLRHLVPDLNCTASSHCNEATFWICSQSITLPALSTCCYSCQLANKNPLYLTFFFLSRLFLSFSYSLFLNSYTLLLFSDLFRSKIGFSRSQPTSYKQSTAFIPQWMAVSLVFSACQSTLPSPSPSTIIIFITSYFP